FIGREAEANEVVRLVKESRLVTLSGPGRTGKTRLSPEVASRLRDEFAGGVFFVDLSTLTDPSLIPTSIGTALGVREEPDKPVLASLQAFLRDRSILLVLDNIEQLESSAPLVGELLTAAPRLKVIV